jgi:superfamily I DNA/RNA helicase
MFRTPRYIAELATRFILGDPLARSEFEEHGYTGSFTYPNKLKNVAEVLRSSRPAQETAQRVRAFLDTTYSEEDILVVTSAERLPQVENALAAQDVRYVLGEPEHGVAVSLVDFMGVKGLEKEVVVVSGIEDLYDRSKPQRMFEDEEDRYQEELLSRRKVYVALTRTLEQLIIYYQDPNNRFVSELLEINNDILDRW